MDSSQHVTVPLRYGIKKMRKRRDLDALLTQNHQKAANMRRCNANRTIYSHDKLLHMVSTDDQDDDNWQPHIKQVPHYCASRKNKRFIYRIYTVILVLLVFGVFVGFSYLLNYNLQLQIREYRQRVEQVAASSQLIPDTLQSWHATSTQIIKNQSLLFVRMMDLQNSIQELSRNFSSHLQKDDLHAGFVRDEKFVADFGARIEAIAIDVDTIKDHYQRLNDKQENLQKNFHQLKLSCQNGTRNLTKPKMNYSVELNKLRLDVSSKFSKLLYNLTYMNDTLNQKLIITHDELIKHKNQLDELFDSNANITSHVNSLENSWPDLRQKVTDLHQNVVPRWQKEINKMKANTEHLEMALRNVCVECKDSYMANYNPNQTSSLLNTIAAGIPTVSSSPLLSSHSTTLV